MVGIQEYLKNFRQAADSVAGALQLLCEVTGKAACFPSVYPEVRPAMLKCFGWLYRTLG